MIGKFLALSLLLLSTACASITQGTTQAMTFQTEPPGASCHVSRNGETLGIVNPTPGTITVSKSSAALTVRCERPGYQAGLTSVPSSLQAMAAGNLLFGGVIGLGIDAASGAMNQYPPNVAVSLPIQPPPPIPEPQPMAAQPEPIGRRGRN